MLLCLGLFAVALVVLLFVAGSQSGNKGEAEPEVVPKMKRAGSVWTFVNG